MPYSEKQLAANAAILGQGVEVQVELVVHSGKRAPGTVRLLALDESARLARALKFFGASAGIGTLAIVAPPHIVWFLSGLVVGTIGALARYRQGARLLGGRATCPACGALQLLLPEPAEFPFAHFCTECRERSLVEKRSP